MTANPPLLRNERRSVIRREIPSCDVVFENAESSWEALRKILEIVRPEWNPDDVSWKILPKGMLNTNTVLYENSGQREKDALVLKTQREFYVGPIHETHRVCRFLHEEGLSCEILALFNNGICMEFVQGESLEWNSPALFEEQNWKSVAENMAEWHRKDILGKAKAAGIRKTNVMLGNVEKFWDSIMSRDPMRPERDEFPTKDQVILAEKSLREDMLEHGELDEVLCHMDVNASNLIVQGHFQGQGRVHFVDYDFVGLNYAQYDLASYFCSFLEPSNPGPGHIPDKEYQMNFLRHYLQTRKFLDRESFGENEVETLFRQVQIAQLFFHLRITVGTAFVRDFTGLKSFLPFAKKVWREFEVTKRALLKAYRRDEDSYTNGTD